MKNLRQAYNELLKYGGFTINPNYIDNDGDFLAPLIGFMVSDGINEIQISSGCTEIIFNIVLSSFIAEHQNELNKGGFVGCWTHEDTIYLDISYNVQDAKEAVLLGYTNKQLAIYDIEAKKSVQLPTPQTKGTEYQKEAYKLEKANNYAKHGKFYL